MLIFLWSLLKYPDKQLQRRLSMLSTGILINLWVAPITKDKIISYVNTDVFKIAKQ